ncbi:MAG: sirohydrochlorin chelatase [Pseudanabaena sp.]|jgi:sirohydrochlorin ferrochelatase
MNATALFLVTHGSSDRRSWLALQNLVAVARSRKNKYGDDYDNRYISGGCLEGQELSLSQQLEQFATEVIPDGVSEIVILPLFLLEGVHVSEDIPEQVAIAESKLTDKLAEKFPDKSSDRSIFRLMAHVGTDKQIPSLLLQHFEKYSDESGLEKQGRILMAHGSRRFGANQVVEDLATQSQSIAAYWGVEPKIETQIENLLAQGFHKINVLPYFLTEGGITEAIANKLELYRDRTQIQQLPVPLSNEQIVDLALKLI